MTVRASKIRVVIGGITASIVIPSIPVAIWWYKAQEDRSKLAENVRTKVRVPGVQTTDDRIIQSIKPGDVIVFDRRCETCAAGPLSALNCILSKHLLCYPNNGTGVSTLTEGSSFDHVGVVVPGYSEEKYHDSSDLLLLEATASGIVARPLLTRLEMSRSRTVLFLPLCAPGEIRRRGFNLMRETEERIAGHKEEDDKVQKLGMNVRKQLKKFRDVNLAASQHYKYQNYHSLIGLSGCLAYAIGQADNSHSPVSPAAWLVVSALQSAGIAMHVDGLSAMTAKPEDFLRDHRFNEKDTIRLRPGWKFLPPLTLRENSR
jgi:hypothetical protein